MKNEHSTLPEKISAVETLAAVQLCPFGEFPNGKTVQLCDQKAFDQIVAEPRCATAISGSEGVARVSWRGGVAPREILCDFEHKSEDPSLTSDTAAAAWISNLAVDPERGLAGDLKFTDLGAEAVTFAEEHKEVCNKESPKSAYLMNKEAARALVAGYIKPDPRCATAISGCEGVAPRVAQTILNKETVVTLEVKLNKIRAGLAACDRYGFDISKVLV